MWNSHLVSSVSKTLAQHGQPNFLTTAQQRLSGPQIFGYTDNSKERLASSIASYMPELPDPRYIHNDVINTIMKQPEEQLQQPQLTEAFEVATTADPKIQQASAVTLPRLVQINEESIVISKKTFVTVILAVILIVVFRLWLRQCKLEELLERKSQLQRTSRKYYTDNADKEF